MKVFIFILCFLPWFASVLVPLDYSYFDQLKLPFFTPPSAFYGVAWTIVYFFIAISICSILSAHSFSKIPKSYWLTLVINYLFNQSFVLVFFGLKSNFWGFVSCLGTFVTSLFLYHETFQLQEKSTKALDPYVLLSLFATILSLTIYIMNSLSF